MSVWSRINGVAGKIQSNITHFAAEVLEAVDEVRASDNEDEIYEREHEAHPSAAPSVEGSAVASRLSALKARLEADRSRAAVPKAVRQHSQQDELHQRWETAPPSNYTGIDMQTQAVGQENIFTGTGHHDSAAVRISGRQPDGTSSQISNVPNNEVDPGDENAFEEVMLSSRDKQVHSSSHISHLSPDSDVAHSSDVERLKKQIQRLKSELVRTIASHEEEQEHLEKAHQGQTDAMAREISELKEQCDIARKSAGQTSQSSSEIHQGKEDALDDGVAHARIMELQVRIKELQAENVRLAADSTAKQASESIPFGTATEAAFWSANSEAENERLQKLQAQLQALQTAAQTDKASAHADVQSERNAHAETQRLLAESQAALQEVAGREQARSKSAEQAHECLQSELQQVQAALHSQQLQAQSGLEAEHSAHAFTRQRLAEIEESVRSRSASLEKQLEEERLRHEQTALELEKVRQQLAASRSEEGQDLQAEKQRLREALEELDRVRQELAAAVHARAEADSALAAERSTKEAQQSLEDPAVLEGLPLVVELRSQLHEQQTTSLQLQVDAELLRQRCETLAQENERLTAEAEQLQQMSVALQDAGARASALERDAASCRRDADQERLALNDLQSRFAETSAALEKGAKEGVELQRQLDSAMRQLEETAMQKSAEPGPSLQLLQEQLAAEQDGHRKSKAKVDRVRADLGQLQQALDASTSALTDRDAFWKEELLRAQRDLQSCQAQVAELEQRCHAAEARLLNGTASSSVPGMTVASSNGVVERSPVKLAQPEEAGPTASEVAHLRKLLAAAEDERDRARQQLNRLKQATMAEQEDEEDKMRWRVEAEVRLAMESAQQAEAQRQAHYERELANLRADLEFSKAQAERLGTDVEAWNAAVAARDAEIQNLQAALGELAYSSEAAERLRAELRASAAKLRSAQDDIAATKRELQEGAAARQTIEAELTALKQEQQKQSDFAARLSEETVMLRRALAESMKRLKLAHSDADAMVDRRIVTKLLITYFERGRSDQSVLNLMASMLGFTEEEKKKVGLASKAGILRTVAGAPLALVKGLAKSGGEGPGTPTSGDASLANEWVEFLIQQAEAADAVEANGRSSGGGSQTYEPQMPP